MTRLNEAVKAERGALSLTIAGDIGRSFHMQASLNTKVVKPVMHIALSFMKEDEPAQTDRRMLEIAEDYLRRMKLENTQYVVIRHHKPGGNPHVHIILNLVGNDGNRLDTDFIRRRNINVCKDLNRAYGLHWSSGKDNTDVEKLRSKEKTRYEIYHTVKSALNGSSGWQVLHFQRVDDRPKHELFGTDEAAGEEQHQGVREHKSIRNIKAGVLCTRSSGGPYGEPNSRSSEG